MSWLEQLVQTYEENAHLAGRFGVDGMKSILPPVGHAVRNAQIEMILDRKGELISVELLPKEQQQTLLPCTPDSASRSSTKSFPHPLHDNLSYIARDYEKFVPAGKKAWAKDRYEEYKALLGAWAKSSHSDPAVCAVYRYIKNHDVISDLFAKGVFQKDDKGHMVEKWNIKKNEKPPSSESPLKALVRFRVDLVGDSCPELWQDTELQQKYQQFFRQAWS